MDLISEFIARYRKEFDFYEQACRIVAQILDLNLQSAGIRAIVTSRAKNPIRLEAKTRQRATEKEYHSIQDIYEDIVDLAGVRVALYFPGERDEVGKIVRNLFQLVADPKEFPTATQPTYTKRFSGYWATHYRVRLQEASLNESQKRYTEAKIEIQVASVLMHAWAEVEHDLVYKPLQGSLSSEEYAILDELNGLVLSGEIALERLQRAGEVRASTNGRAYANHYDLAASLLDLARDNLRTQDLSESAMGRVDLLFDLLKRLNLNTPEEVGRYVKVLHHDFDKRPVSEQIIDQMLAEDDSRYALYEEIRSSELPVSSEDEDSKRSSQNQVVGEFLSLWIQYEKKLRSMFSSEEVFPRGMTPVRLVYATNISKDAISSAERLRRFRNSLVHGIEMPDIETIKGASEDMRTLLMELDSSIAKNRRAKKKETKAKDAHKSIKEEKPPE